MALSNWGSATALIQTLQAGVVTADVRLVLTHHYVRRQTEYTARMPNGDILPVYQSDGVWRLVGVPDSLPVDPKLVRGRPYVQTGSTPPEAFTKENWPTLAALWEERLAEEAPYPVTHIQALLCAAGSVAGGVLTKDWAGREGGELGMIPLTGYEALEAYGVFLSSIGAPVPAGLKTSGLRELANSLTPPLPLQADGPVI